LINQSVLRSLPDAEKFLDHCQRKSLRSRSTLVRAGETSDTFFFVLNGSLSVIIRSDDGHDLVLNYVNPGEFFGEIGVYKKEQKERYATVLAKSDCEVAEISYDDFDRLKEEFPAILYQIGVQMADRLTDATRRLHDLAFLDARGRLLNTLLSLCKEPDAMTHPDGMQIKVSRQELGRLAGCSREVAGRLLKVLESEGVVQVSGHTMVVFGTR
jgi:CRP/FNR family cyclic AMP-dependent transcriptional regulator